MHAEELDPQVFFVTSHGWSGSTWLANCLDALPDTTCSHLMLDRHAAPGDSDAMLANAAIREQARQACIDRLSVPVTAVIRQIRSGVGARWAGNVGFYRLRDLPDLVGRFGPPEPAIRVANLIRDPVALVISGYHQFRKRFRFDLNELHWNLNKLLRSSHEFIRENATKHRVDPGDTDNLAFYSAANTLASLQLDAQADERMQELSGVEFVGHRRLEDLATSRDAVARLLRDLLPNQEVSTQDLQAVFGAGPVNAHYEGHDAGASERFAQLAPWQQEAFVFYWQRHELRGFYERHGYSFDYLPD